MARYASDVVGSAILVAAMAVVQPLTGWAQMRPSSPVTIERNEENPARQPFFTRLDVPPFLVVSQSSLSNTFTVPSGKRLVIEYVSGTMAADVGQKAGLVVFAGPVGSPSGLHVLVPTHRDTSGGQEHFDFSAPVRLYVDQGVTVQCEGTRDQSGGTSAGGPCLISGYFVDIP
jgi:hypothetical protein